MLAVNTCQKGSIAALAEMRRRLCVFAASCASSGRVARLPPERGNVGDGRTPAGNGGSEYFFVLTSPIGDSALQAFAPLSPVPGEDAQLAPLDRNPHFVVPILLRVGKARRAPPFSGPFARITRQGPAGSHETKTTTAH